MTTHTLRIVRSAHEEARPAATHRPSWIELATERARTLIGKFCNRLRVPGTIAPIVIDDEMTGNRIEIEVTPRATILRIGWRDYSFDRLTGDYVGQGSAVNRDVRFLAADTQESEPSPTAPDHSTTP